MKGVKPTADHSCVCEHPLTEWLNYICCHVFFWPTANLISLVWSIQCMVLFEFGGASKHRSMFWVHKPAVRQGCWQEKLHISAADCSSEQLNCSCRKELQDHQISLSGSVSELSCDWVRVPGEFQCIILQSRHKSEYCLQCTTCVRIPFTSHWGLDVLVSTFQGLWAVS